MRKTITLHIAATDSLLYVNDAIRIGDYDAYDLELVYDAVEAITGDVRLRFLRSDGQLILTAPVAVEGNVVSYTLTTSDLAVVSPLKMWVQFSDSNLFTPTLVIFSKVETVALGTPIPETDEYPEYLAAIEAASDAADSANAAAAAASGAADLANAAAAEAQEIVDTFNEGGYVTTDQSTPQTFTGGVPKVAADVIVGADENELATVKFVNGYSMSSTGHAPNLYFTTLDSVVPGYKQMSYTLEPTETILTIPITTTEQLIRTYIHDADIGVSVIDGGMWSAMFKARVNASQGAYMRIEAFLRSALGVETTLFSATYDKIVNTTFLALDRQTNQPAFNCEPTDRLGFRVYAQAVLASVTTLYTILGDGDAAHIHTPLAIRHNQIRDPNGDPEVQHMTAAEKTAVGSIATTVSSAVSTHNSDADAHANLIGDINSALAALLGV